MKRKHRKNEHKEQKNELITYDDGSIIVVEKKSKQDSNRLSYAIKLTAAFSLISTMLLVVNLIV